MFDTDQFIQDCLNSAREEPDAIREVVQKTISDNTAAISEHKAFQQLGIVPLYRSARLTIIHYAWPSRMSLLPHNHNMFAIIGVYSGRENNIFWQRAGTTIETAGVQSLGAGDIAVLGTHAIHSVFNPLARTTSAFHIYGGDIFSPDTPRSEWDPETLIERPWSTDSIRSLLGQDME
ncbi:hypothetical protein DGMP_23040 [Desulfomarina profundi]|uniref:Uncharacterized protein n=1 Tax=Desulfomarina profundi TaxID=2772557 RepID=A0A8D5JS14_9BACT|nr:hypothetical protein [Desulfomarina profundi]BCL61611.1 hypothetical protein DGMP_23040 [Desulfomarina profundi]